MTIYYQNDIKGFVQLLNRTQISKVDLQDTILEIFNSVNNDGDKALRYFTSKYDGVTIDNFKVDLQLLINAFDSIDESLKKAILTAKHNIEQFHRQQIRPTIEVETTEGVLCKTRFLPIQRVGLYIPGGSAPLFSTMLMLCIPAKLAGCEEIIMCTPPSKFGIDKALLATAYICGITEVYQVGGAQAIAGMALGTESIKKVSKIFGPGNQYVSKAKEIATQFGVAMDLPAGPSELLVYADDSCVPAFVASDLLSQAEHGTDSQVVALVTNDGLADSIKTELYSQLEKLPRKEIAMQALENSFILVESNIERAFDFINDYAPEHLSIASNRDDYLLDKVVNAGSIFLGNYSPESAGDYASGTNHTLPTNGWAKSFSGLSVDTFLRQISIQKLTEEGIKNIGSTIIQMAEAEHLEGHANAVKLRLNYLLNNKPND